MHVRNNSKVLYNEKVKRNINRFKKNVHQRVVCFIQIRLGRRQIDKHQSFCVPSKRITHEHSEFVIAIRYVLSIRRQSTNYIYKG